MNLCIAACPDRIPLASAHVAGLHHQLAAITRGRGDDLDVEVGERAARGARDADEPLPHDVQRVLGGEEQHPAGARDREVPHARRARRDRDGEVEREEGLAALGLATDDADSLVYRCEPNTSTPNASTTRVLPIAGSVSAYSTPSLRSTRDQCAPSASSYSKWLPERSVTSS